jgi:hypothetical protein
MRIKTIARVPWQVLAVLLAALAAQLTFASLRQAPRVSVSALPSPPSAAVLRVVSLDQPALAARLMMLWLQAYDYQPGVSLPFRGLDYAAIEAWLARMLELDPTFQYPLLAAARLYGEVDDARASGACWPSSRAASAPIPRVAGRGSPTACISPSTA